MLIFFAFDAAAIIFRHADADMTFSPDYRDNRCFSQKLIPPASAMPTTPCHFAR
jgi:hypothetical protein